MGIAEAAGVAVEHFDIGQKMVGKKDGLGALEVRVARHDRGAVALGEADEFALEALEFLSEGIAGFAQPESEIEGDLVVAAPRGVELRAGGADALGQLRFDVHVDILEVHLELEASLLDLGEDLAQAGFDFFKFLRGENASGLQRAGVGDASRDVMPVKLPIDRDRLAVAFEEIGLLLLETTFPHERVRLSPPPDFPFCRCRVAGIRRSGLRSSGACWSGKNLGGARCNFRATPCSDPRIR